MDKQISDLLEDLIVKHGWDVMYGLLEQIEEVLRDVPQKTKREFILVHKDSL